MPADTDALNIIEINFNAIGAEQTGGSDKCCANMHTFQGDYTNMNSISKSNNKTGPMFKSNSYKTIEYFLSGLSYESDKKGSAETTQQIHKGFEDVFNVMGCFDCTSSFQLKPDSKPHQVHALQKSLERIRRSTITGHNSTSRG